MILLDTNVLGRLADTGDPLHATAHRAVTILSAAADRPVIVPQIFFEFWAVATRRRGAPPAGQNGLEMTASVAGTWLRFFKQQFVLLADQADLVERWQQLVEGQGIIGLRSHDARLVAAMQTHGIERMLTFNGRDFRGMPIKVVDPATL